MKNKLIILVMIVSLLFGLVGCNTTKQLTQEDLDNGSRSEYSMFIELEQGSVYSIVYHKDTKVMYAISNGSYNFGTFTVMVNADGSPMLYEGR